MKYLCGSGAVQIGSEGVPKLDDVPPDQKQFTALNAELSKVWKPIIERKPAPPDADEWKGVKSKLSELQR